jgi:hypothetical protein
VNAEAISFSYMLSHQFVLLVFWTPPPSADRDPECHAVAQRLWNLVAAEFALLAPFFGTILSLSLFRFVLIVVLLVQRKRATALLF